MTEGKDTPDFNILIVAQAGRLAHEAVLFTESLRKFSPRWRGRLIVAEPRNDGCWAGHVTAIPDGHRALLTRLGAEITPFTARHFGADYPNGNKIEALALLPVGQPFLFFDTDTLITGPLDSLGVDFSRPTASMRREGTWPQPPLYGPGYDGIWRSLYDRFGLDMHTSLDPEQPAEHWERYLYFNAGWFLGPDPAPFAQRFCDWAVAVRDEPGDALASQTLDPWLDQVILPLVIHSLGGGRPGRAALALDGDVSCHYRLLPLLYAREGDAVVNALEFVASKNRVKKLIRGWEPADQLVYQAKGREAVRPIFAGEPLPPREQPIRQRLRKEGWWLV